MKSSKNKYGFYTFSKEDGLYYFQLNDEMGEPILFSLGYQSGKSRDNGIKTVIRNAGDDQHYEIKKAPKGQFLFILKAGNHQEIGRSRIFGSQQEMEQKLKVLKALKKDTPVFNSMPASEEGEAIGPLPEKTFRQGEVQRMPRYKFSIIYYPDSEIWSIIHDLSGDSKQFGTYNGKLIEEFLRAHLPTGKPEPAQLERPEGKAISPEQQKKVSRETIELKLRNVEGDEIGNFAKIDQFHEMEILLKEGTDIASQPYETEVLAKSFEANDTLVIGKIRDQLPKDNRLLIPLNRTHVLKPGMYRITALVHPRKEGNNYEGSKLVMLD
jgi:uncharacterized protein YegP (UPF0339 family)